MSGTATPGRSRRWRNRSGQAPTPIPASSLGVSCTAVTACTAVGDFYENDFADDVPLAEFWNGTTWTVSPTPNPAGSSDAGLVSVSCASTSSCIAIGNLSDLGHPFIESWNGAKWSVHDQPTVPGFLYGVSCPSASACTAVGYASEGKNVPLIETWNGKTWSVETVPNPAGSVDSVLSAVSCASTSACTAVGDYYNGSELDSTLVEAWNGGAWAIEPSPERQRCTAHALPRSVVQHSHIVHRGRRIHEPTQEPVDVRRLEQRERMDASDRAGGERRRHMVQRRVMCRTNPCARRSGPCSRAGDSAG